jgi:AraC-like DNA-binding protein
MIIWDSDTYPYSNDNLLHCYESVPGFKRRDFTEHRHTAFELSLICSGSGIYRIGEKQVPIREGDIFFFATNEVHCITEVSGTEEMRLLNLQFEPRLLWSAGETLGGYELAKFLPRQSRNISNRIPSGSSLAKQITPLICDIKQEAMEHHDAYDLMMKTSLLKILVILMREFSDNGNGMAKPVRSDNYKPITNALDLIHQKLGENISLDELAASADMSRTYFCSVFKKLNGITPWEYINIKRIEKAKQLLRTTQKTVLEISLECGFNNLSHFNRVFLRITAQKPSDYRKHM